MSRRVLIIANPSAGRMRSRRALGRHVEALRRRGCEVVVRHAGAMGDVERLAREAEPEFDVVVAAGGDGTVNAVVNGIAAGPPRPIGVLPLGTVNLLAREAGLRCGPDSLAEIIATAPARPIWPGSIGGRLFVIVASIGFDADVVAAVDPAIKDRVGRLAFVWSIAKCLWVYRRGDLVVEIDGIGYRAAGVIAAKGRYYAGPFIAAPGACVADPTLDLVLLQRSGRLQTIRYLSALVCRVLPRLRDVAILRGRRVSVTGAQSRATQADGEVIGCLPITIGVADRPVFLVRPA